MKHSNNIIKAIRKIQRDNKCTFGDVIYLYGYTMEELEEMGASENFDNASYNLQRRHTANAKYYGEGNSQNVRESASNQFLRRERSLNKRDGWVEER